MNRRRRPFQGVNNLYLQLLRRLAGLPKYGEIRIKRTNQGWGITGGDFLTRARQLWLKTTIKNPKFGAMTWVDGLAFAIEQMQGAEFDGRKPPLPLKSKRLDSFHIGLEQQKLQLSVLTLQLFSIFG